MRIKDVLLGIFIGNAIAGAIMLVVSMPVTEVAIIDLLLIIIVAISIDINKKKKIIKEKTTLDYEA